MYEWDIVMFGFLKKTPVIDDEAVQWIFETYAWALKNFDAQEFFQQSILVTPSNEHFPGRVDSAYGMAELIFERVKAYAGMSHWPTKLMDQTTCSIPQNPRVVVEGALRGRDGIASDKVADEHRLLITYAEQQLNQPEALIATYAHTLAHYLGSVAPEAPPGGEEHWPHATELLAIFMGFGLMFANSAYVYRGGCSSCYNPAANRSAFLSQEESTYALALFCVLKEIPNNKVLSHLKKHLRPLYKRALQDIAQRSDEVAGLRALEHAKPDEGKLLGQADETSEGLAAQG